MQSIESSKRFFGVDMSALWRDCLTAWRGMGRWPVVSWLWPRSDIGVLQPDLSLVLSRGLQAVPIADGARARNARYGAVVLPENMLLRRTLQLPKLQSDDLTTALWLEVQTLSPFPIEDLQWSYQTGSEHANNQSVHIVLASKKLIAQYLNGVRAQSVTPTPEVWVTSATGSGFVMLAGYGEAPRLRSGSAWGWASAVLVFVIVALMAALLITPSAQLLLRVQDAARAMKDLQKRAEPVLAQRESLLGSVEQLAQAREIIGKPLAPLQILQILTYALPDDTSLLSMQAQGQGQKVTITGQTGNAAALMKQLGGFPGLQNVKAPTPAVKPPGATKESFSIEFSVDSTQIQPLPVAPGGGQ